MRSRTFARRSIAVAIAFAAVGRSAPGLAAPRYNVLLISIDSLRRDAVGCYGARSPYAGDAAASPTLDRLATSGVRFDDAYAPSPWTLPSHVTLMTGRSPVAHQVETDLNTMRPGETTLAEILRGKGYRTAGVFSGPYLEPHWGFGLGFERYHAAYGADVAAASHEIESIDRDIARAEQSGDRTTADELRWTRRKAYEHVRELSHQDVSSDRVTVAALEDLQRLIGSGAPWLLFVHYFDVHYDYVPPPPFEARFDPEYAGTMTGRGFLQNPAIALQDPNQLDGFIRQVSERDLAHLRALYAGEVARVDQHVGRLLELLDATKAGRTTLVVVLSDHGHEFFEHGGIGHRRNLNEEVLRIPLIARLPDVLPAGRTVRGLVSLGDVTPTILDVLGVPPLPSMTGRTLMPLVRGEEDAHARIALSRLVRAYEGVASFVGGDKVPIRLASVQEAFRYGDIKIFRRRQWPLFPAHLPDEERRDLQAQADRSFRKEEIAWIDEAKFPAEPGAEFSREFADPRAHTALAMYRRRYRELRAAIAPVAANPPSPAVREQLEGLGYVETAESAPVSPRDGFVLPLPGNAAAGAPR
jgi:arylsulfatase A-like enzyme